MVRKMQSQKDELSLSALAVKATVNDGCSKQSRLVSSSERKVSHDQRNIPATTGPMRG
jgi:hypothetical protein